MSIFAFIKSLFTPSMGKIYKNISKNVNQLESRIKVNDEMSDFKTKMAFELHRDVASLCIESSEMQYGINNLKSAINGSEAKYTDE